jgi:glutamate/tyrosine decarboxylase-like PLP-dependent enzyme
LILQNRCVNMIAHLFNASLGEDETAVGVGTVGSSEAIMLAGLAFKRRWQNKMRAAGKPCDKPNIVTGANVQVSGFVICSVLYCVILDHMCSSRLLTRLQSEM